MTMDFNKYRDKLLFVPLGGSNEIGMNLNLYYTEGKWLMVDCGIGFAHDYLPGVEIVVPDIDFIAERKKDLLGLVLTHAHEDHIGAVPYLWRDFECPLFATPFTSSLLKHKFDEMGPGKKPVITEVMPGGKFALGPFDMEFIGITHSIPEMQGVVIRTKAGSVMHTGDWKFDESPQVGPASDYEKLVREGNAGIDAMVCDSTNVLVDGTSGSEEMVREHLTKLILSCKQRVVVTTFASNIARLETILLAAHQAGRVVALAGRSIRRMVDAAHDAGYLVKENEFVQERDIMNVARQDALIICTGCQGEPRAALPRMAKGEHPNIRLTPGDTVIYSARKIPGNETRIHFVKNHLTKRGIEIVTDKDQPIHVSGHPAREELKRMYAMVKPAIAIPTHGEAMHLHEHAKLAKSIGVKETVEAYNGAVILIEKGEAGIVGSVKAGLTAIDGLSLIPADSPVIRTRRKLRDDGAVFVALCANRAGELLAPPSLSTPGLLDRQEDAELIKEMVGEITHAIGTLKGRPSDEQLRETVQKTLRSMFKQELDKKPVIEVQVMRI